MKTLGIESSCDDTAAAVLDGNHVLANVLSSQDSIHTRFGGVVPELASRSHLQSIHPVVNLALEKAETELSEIDLIAVTQGPGLMGSLLVGFSYAKALAHTRKIPVVGVDHMAGHILAAHLSENPPAFPYIALIVSGGTSSIFLAKGYCDFELLGRTRDDAAGEAFDKVAKLLGLPYPGGPHVSSQAESGDGTSYKFPRAWLKDHPLDFSFSGLKTSVLNEVNKQRQKNCTLNLPDICASFQESVVEVLVEKTLLAARKHQIENIVIGGGVSANKRLRTQFSKRCVEENFVFFAPDLIYCTDNAAMIGYAGTHAFQQSGALTADQDVYSRSRLG